MRTRKSDKVNRFIKKNSRYRISTRNIKVSLRILKAILRVSGIIVVTLGFIFIGLNTNKLYKYYFKVAGTDITHLCPGVLLDIPDNSLYGVIFNMDGNKINKISVLKIKDKDLDGFFLSGNSWVTLQNTKYFKESQVSQLYKTAILETDETESKCFLIRQITFLSGVPLEFAIFINNGKIDASTWSQYRINRVLDRLAKAHLKQPDLTLASLSVLPDGSEIRVINYGVIATQFGETFVLPDIKRERAFIEVYNATGRSGYASFWARNLKMLGLDVSRVGNAPNFLRSKDNNGVYDVAIYIEHYDDFPKTMILLQYLLSNKKINIIHKRPEGMITTGDIILILFN